MNDELLNAAQRVVETYETDDLDANDAAIDRLRTIVHRETIRRLAADNTEIRAERDALRACVAELQKQLTAHQTALADTDARLGRRLDEAIELGARVDDLQRLVAERDARVAMLEAQLEGHELTISRFELQNDRPTPAPTFDPCPHCGRRDFNTPQGRGGHIVRCAKNTNRLPAPSELRGAGVRVAATAPAEDDPNWRCEVCKSDAHARDLHDPARCIRCAQSFGRAA